MQLRRALVLVQVKRTLDAVDQQDDCSYFLLLPKIPPLICQYFLGYVTQGQLASMPYGLIWYNIMV
jgi:hypothetical protein